MLRSGGKAVSPPSGIWPRRPPTLIGTFFTSTSEIKILRPIFKIKTLLYIVKGPVKSAHINLKSQKCQNIKLSIMNFLVVIRLASPSSLTVRLIQFSDVQSRFDFKKNNMTHNFILENC